MYLFSPLDITNNLSPNLRSDLQVEFGPATSANDWDEGGSDDDEDEPAAPHHGSSAPSPTPLAGLCG